MTPLDGACRQRSLVAGETLAGKAPLALGWLLVEDQGPWGIEAPVERLAGETGLDHDDARERLAGFVRATGLRVLLVRRPERARRDGARRLVVRAGELTSGPQALDDGCSLQAALDRVVRSQGMPPGSPGRDAGAGSREEGPDVGECVPMVLVCTNGRRDACCADVGRPFAAALATEPGLDVWECSHLGGDRFAANALLVPHGISLGRLGPALAPAFAAALRDGRIDPAWWRGRTTLPPAAQAAEVLVRRQRGLDAVADVRVVGPPELLGTAGEASRRWSCPVEIAGTETAVEVVERTGTDLVATCRSATATATTEWELAIALGHP